MAPATDGRLFFCLFIYLFIYYLFSLCPTSDLLKQELISPGGRLLSWQLTLIIINIFLWLGGPGKEKKSQWRFREMDLYKTHWRQSVNPFCAEKWGIPLWDRIDIRWKYLLEWLSVVASCTCGFWRKVSWFVTHPPADIPGFHSLLCLKRCHRLENENLDVFIKWHIVALVKWRQKSSKVILLWK